jgi:hypothetical protein
VKTLFLLFLAAPAAHADDSVVRVGRGELGGLLWLAGGDACSGGAAVWSRQCQAIRAARTARIAAKTFVIHGDTGALTDGVVRGCLACAEPLHGRFVVTRGDVAKAAAGVQGPELGRIAAPAPDVRVDIYFRVTTPDAWSQGGARGLFVEPVGWRVYDCKGDVLGASPATPQADHDDRTGCAEVRAAAPPPAETELPAQPTAEQIKAAMDAVAPAVTTCFDRYGVPGTAEVALEVNGDGAVGFAGVHGTFADTPTGACITAAVHKARFPRFARAPLRFHYPFVLR